MRILVLNSGSSSLKFRLYDARDGEDSASPFAARVVAGGSVAEIGGDSTLSLSPGDPAPARRPVPDHAVAVRWTLEHLPASTIEAVGHRIVHGGARFREPVRIDDTVLQAIEALSDLAPLHNPPGVAGIRGARDGLGPLPMVAVFDTAFHHTLPAAAATYALPADLARRHGIRRYGFHGIAHASLAQTYAAATGRPLEGSRLVTLQLGNGCSASALRDGRSIDTSMGFTPLEGLVMGTRSGDLDASIVGYLARREGVAVEVVDRWLNERSGLLGLSGLTHDMQELLAAEQRGHEGARLAIDVFCHRARKYLGASLAALGGADAVVFGGGIGEHAASIRARICDGMAWCGLRLDPDRNAAARDLPPGRAVPIGAPGAAIAAFVAAVDEESCIARETFRCLRGDGAPRRPAASPGAEGGSRERTS